MVVVAGRAVGVALRLQSGWAAVRFFGKVEKIPTPGAAMSTKIGSSSEKSGTLPERVRAPTPITCGSAAGQLAYGHGVVYASSEFPTAATTTAPFFTA